MASEQNLGSPFLFTTKDDKDNLTLPENQHYTQFYQLDAYHQMMPPEYATYHYDPYAIPYQYQQPEMMEQVQEETIPCPHEGCEKTFKKQSSLHSHLRTHTNVPKPFLCRIYLKRHEYIHSKDKPFICDQCNRGFSRRDALKRHLDSMRNRPGGCSGRKKD